MSTTTVESDGVWPAVEVSDSSDDENETSVSLRNSENLCSVSEQEINGGFPLLKGYESNEGSSEEEEVEEEVKMNPYLAHMEDQHKYENKLRELHLKRNEARKLNHQEVAAEDQRNKLPKNYEARRRKAEWELEQKEAKKRAMEAGENYEETKLLEETAESVDIFDRRKKKKKNQDPGFADYAASQLRQYERLTGQMKPDLESYNQSKEKLGEAAFPGAHNLMYGGSDKPSEEAIDRMVGDLEKQIEKRSKFHRRRAFHEDSDVDYINEKNMKFNKKAERYYGQYTQEIKDNLERGTAI